MGLKAFVTIVTRDCTMSSIDTIIDDLFGDIIANPGKPNTREDDFIEHFCSGKTPRIANLVYWLRSQLSLYDRFCIYGLVVADTKGLALKRVQLNQIARVLIEHYLMQTFAHWFQSGSFTSVAADIDQVIDRVIAQEIISKVIFSDNRA